MKYILILVLFTLSYINSQENANGDEVFTTEVSNFRIGTQIFRIWATTRKDAESSPRKQFRYDPLFLPVFDSNGNLAIQKTRVNENWRIQLTILLDSPHAASEAYNVLQQTYPEEKQLQRFNVFAKSIKSISISLPELATHHPRCNLLYKTINFYKPENEFLIVIECPTEEDANSLMQSLPNYRIVYDLSVNSFLSVKNQISINMKALQNSELFSVLDGVAKNGEAYINRKDMRNLLEGIEECLEIKETIEDPESFTNDVVDRMINRYFKRVNVSTENFDAEKWKSTYNADDLKPDVIQKSLDKMFQKDDETGHWKVSKSGSTEANASIAKIFSGGGAFKHSYTRDELQKKLRELDITISFEGNKIIAKSISVYRINLNELKNESNAIYVTTKVRPIGIQIASGLSINLARYQHSKSKHFDLAKRVKDLENTTVNLKTVDSSLLEMLTSLQTANQSLQNANDSLQNSITQSLQYKILAIARVDSQELAYSTPGVQFNKQDGIVTFPNPTNMKFVPVISDSLKSPYLTEMHFIRNINQPNQFQVWRTALDTGNRNNKPYSFTAIVIGIDK